MASMQGWRVDMEDAHVAEVRLQTYFEIRGESEISRLKIQFAKNSRSLYSHVSGIDDGIVFRPYLKNMHCWSFATRSPDYISYSWCYTSHGGLEFRNRMWTADKKDRIRQADHENRIEGGRMIWRSHFRVISRCSSRRERIVKWESLTIFRVDGWVDRWTEGTRDEHVGNGSEMMFGSWGFAHSNQHQCHVISIGEGSTWRGDRRGSKVVHDRICMLSTILYRVLMNQHETNSHNMSSRSN